MRSMHPVLSKQKRLQVASEGGTVEIRVSHPVFTTNNCSQHDSIPGRLHFPPNERVLQRVMSSLSVLTAISRWICVSPYRNVFILDFTGAKGDESGSDSWSCKMCKAAVISSPPTNQHALSLSQFQRPFFQVNLGLPVPIESKDDGGGGDNWTTGAIRHPKLQPNHHHQQTSIQFF